MCVTRQHISLQKQTNHPYAHKGEPDIYEDSKKICVSFEQNIKIL